MAERNKTSEKEAEKLLKNANLIDEYLRTCHERYVGRDDILILVKLATVSRHFERGISIVLYGTASVGKSELFTTVLDTVDENAYQRFTRTTKSFLLYRDRPLAHMIVMFNELSGTKDTAHLIRTALSEGGLSVGTVVGGMPLERFISTEGIVFFSTFASDKLDHELDTRIFKVELNYDSDLGRNVLLRKAHKAQYGTFGIEPKKGFEKQGVKKNGSLAHENQRVSPEIWKVADSLIEPCEVVIPFAERLSEIFPSKDERNLRDFEKVITLIKACTLFHGFQREKKNNKLVANQKDYEVVYRLRSLISQSIATVSDEVKSFLDTALLLTPKDSGILPTRKLIQENLGVSLATIKRRVKSSIDSELIVVVGKGSNQRIRVVDLPEKTIYPLPEPKKLFKK